MSVLRMIELTKHYGKRRGVEGLSLEVVEGEIFGFLGPNGAGKTTTMRLLLGLLRPSSGGAVVLGRDPWTQGPGLRQEIGYLPGELNLNARLKVGELIRHFARLCSATDVSYINSLVEHLELDPSQRIGALSKGNKQKVGLVVAFLGRPRLLILDEPTGGLDPLMQHAFYQLARQARSEGRSIFLSSHVLSEVEHIADRVGIIRGGKLVVVESVRALKAKALRRLTLRFKEPVSPEVFRSLPGVEAVEEQSGDLQLSVAGDIDAVVKTAARFTVESLYTSEADLDEIFLRYYAGGTHVL